MQPHDMGEDPDPTEILPARSPLGVAGEEGVLVPGVLVGRYRIDALLGRGGMGEVYRAEQLEPVRRTVALKLLRQQRLDGRHLAYFEVERQMLAQMRHPGIAQVFDADTIAEGFPYFVMEFIDGVAVTRYCDSHAVPLRERIALFVRICQAVQHAHQKGVIHRDLKPGNLLVDEVDGKPVPKIIDFGIATATSRAQASGSVERAGTPDYMSPEQAGDDPASVDTRSDVYSLGVVLYELLAGTRPSAPHETSVSTPATTLRRPSEQLATLPPGQADQLSRVQGLSARRMHRVLRSELDWIVLKAMQHERANRYSSAAELGEDLQRFLDGRPVLAVPASRRYRWGRFARRHRGALVAAGLVLCALLGGLALSLYGLQQAREQRAVAERRSVELGKVAAFQQSMLEGVDIEAMGLGMATRLREQVAQADPADAAALEQALGHASTADIARGLVEDNILLGAEAAISRDFAEQPALANDLRESVARVRVALGLYAQAAAGFARVGDFRARASGPAVPSTLEARREQASALLNAGDAKAAVGVLEQAMAAAASLPVDHRVRVGLELLESEAIATLGDRPRALAMQQSILARARKAHGERDELTLRAMSSLAITQARSGNVREGKALMETLVPLSTEVHGADHKATLFAAGTLATLRAMTSDFEGAIELQRSLVATQVRTLGSEHPATLSARGNLVNMLMDSGKAEEALPEGIAVVEARSRLLGPDHPQTLRSMLNLSSLHARLGEFEAALALQTKVMEARVRLLGPRHPDTVFIKINHAGTLVQTGQYARALRELERIVPLAREVLEPAHPQLQAALMTQARAHEGVGDLAAEIAAYREVLPMRRGKLGEADANTIEVAWKLSQALLEAGKHDESASLHAQYVAPLLSAQAGTLAPALEKLRDEISGRDSAS
ncbi:MAG: serine/threonine protein kinase [Lysobacteraceae bacterium]|nr:MAG: serine/threonine protein kinase [Xanthomonadaceae bacterium]